MEDIRDSACGKMSQEHCPREKEKISESSSKKCADSKTQAFLFLDLTENGQKQGGVVGDSLSVAWRVLDAQYFGVPQRRKRIYLVADLDGKRAGEILFESEGVSGYSAESFRAWQRTSADIETGIGATGAVPMTLKIRCGCAGGAKEH